MDQNIIDLPLSLLLCCRLLGQLAELPNGLMLIVHLPKDGQEGRVNSYYAGMPGKSGTGWKLLGG